MCAVSMIADHYHEKWQTYLPSYSPLPVRIPTQAEIDEFHTLLAKARKYDKENNQPDCELEEKKQKLLTLATELGITIKFD